MICLTKLYRSIFSLKDDSFHSVLEFCLFDPTAPDTGIVVDDIVVVGHTRCGAMQAGQSLAQGDEEILRNSDSHLHSWLAPIVELARLHPGLDQDSFTIENIKKQVELIAASPIVERHVHRPGGHPVNIHGWLYDISTGLLRDVTKSTKV